MSITAIIGVGTAGCKIVSMLDDTIEYDKILIDKENIQIKQLKKYKEFIFVAPFGGVTGTVVTTDVLEKLHKSVFAKKVLITSMPLSFESEYKHILAKENIAKAKRYCQVFVVSDMNLANENRKIKNKDMFSIMDTRFLNQIDTKLKIFSMSIQKVV